MATTFSFAPATLNLHHHRRRLSTYRPNYAGRVITCGGGNSTDESSRKTDTVPENALLKIAWYSSELLGIAASAFRPPPSSKDSDVGTIELQADESGAIDRALVVETIQEDFERSYFVTGNLTLDAYEEDCEFADPAGSFKGLRRFKRNCTNFGSLLEKSNMKLMKWEDFEVLCPLQRNLTLDAYEEDCEFADPAGSFKGLRRFKRNCTNFGSLLEKSNMKLMKWEDFEDKGIGHWRFSCVLSFPWKPILSATGYTEYYFDPESGKVCRHVEHWKVPKMALFKQIFRPSRGWWQKLTSS